MSNIPDCFYRISVKALVLNETKDKFLITKEHDGRWELPGGGLDWGMSPQEDLTREINEEMGLKTTRIAENPSYFLVSQTTNSGTWIANIVYEAELENLDFTPSDECTEVRFVNKEDIIDMNVFANVKTLADMFNPRNHK